MTDGDGIRSCVAEQIESISSSNPNDDGGGGGGGISSRSTIFLLQYLHPPLNETEMVAIAEAVCRNSRVEKLILSWTLEGSPATSTFVKKVLATHPSLREICLCGNNLGVAGAEIVGLALKSNRSLQVLRLNTNEIGPRGAKALAVGLRSNNTLQTIDLGFNDINDEGTEALAEALTINTTLEELYLWENELTMHGGKVLALALEKSSLKCLCLFGNLLQDEGGKALAKALCKNKSLSRLNINGTEIGNETCKALARALCMNSSLRELSLDMNRITTNGIGVIEDALKHLNYAVEDIAMFDYSAIPLNNINRVKNLCGRNARINDFFGLINQNIPAIPLGEWPCVLEVVEPKPDLLYALLKTKPELCRDAGECIQIGEELTS